MFESWEMLFAILRTGKIDAEGYVGKRMKFEQMDEAVAGFGDVVGRIVFPMDEA
jgi:threonine dehydrogenase-like Zn-dependent dehydrogenase